MTKVEFYTQYYPIAENILKSQRDFPTQTSAERAEASVKNQQDMNKLFSNFIYDDLMGKNVDTYA